MRPGSLSRRRSQRLLPLLKQPLQGPLAAGNRWMFGEESSEIDFTFSAKIASQCSLGIFARRLICGLGRSLQLVTGRFFQAKLHGYLAGRFGPALVLYRFAHFLKREISAGKKPSSNKNFKYY